ncbi:alpha/beta hydrolase [Kitasatospora sp. NPDC096077]|uniref:alpha/beta hydrolase n=1 Tax=Kitasatospora sp. NPDC096077 TaxID=3155544 RepID=UPI00332BF92C
MPGFRLRRRLAAAVLVCVAVPATAGWASGDSQNAVTGPPVGTGSWLADHSLGRRLPAPDTTPVSEIADLTSTLSPAQQESLAERHPLVVGSLDGASVELRYRANAIALRRERDHRQAEADDRALPAREREQAAALADRYAELLAHDGQYLAFDPRGRGQIVEVFGDLSTAQRVAVVVPGSDIDLATFDQGGNPYARTAGQARALREEMARQEPATRVATIAWVGYTTPVGVGVDAATTRLADLGAPRLRRFLEGLAAVNSPAPALICHSYGSVLCAKAVHGLRPGLVTDLVAVASPGMHADSAAGLGTGARVWAVRDDSDWVGAVPKFELLGLGHGRDPTDPGFGARVVSAEGADGHAGYFVPGTESLANFARITLGSYPSVRCAATPPAEDCRHDLD